MLQETKFYKQPLAPFGERRDTIALEGLESAQPIRLIQDDKWIDRKPLYMLIGVNWDCETYGHIKILLEELDP